MSTTCTGLLPNDGSKNSVPLFADPQRLQIRERLLDRGVFREEADPLAQSFDRAAQSDEPDVDVVHHDRGECHPDSGPGPTAFSLAPARWVESEAPSLAAAAVCRNARRSTSLWNRAEHQISHAEMTDHPGAGSGKVCFRLRVNGNNQPEAFPYRIKRYFHQK